MSHHNPICNEDTAKSIFDEKSFCFQSAEVAHVDRRTPLVCNMSITVLYYIAVILSFLRTERERVRERARACAPRALDLVKYVLLLVAAFYIMILSRMLAQ